MKPTAQKMKKYVLHLMILVLEKDQNQLYL